MHSRFQRESRPPQPLHTRVLINARSDSKEVARAWLLHRAGVWDGSPRDATPREVHCTMLCLWWDRLFTDSPRQNERRHGAFISFVLVFTERVVMLWNGECLHSLEQQWRHAAIGVQQQKSAHLTTVKKVGSQPIGACCILHQFATQRSATQAHIPNGWSSRRSHP